LKPRAGLASRPRVTHVEAGRFGELALLRLKRHAPQAWFHAYGHTIHPMLESTIHDVDLCIWYVGALCHRIYAVDRSFLGRDGPDTSLAVLEFASGTVAVIDASWLLPAGAPQTTVELGGTLDASLEIVGTQATARLEFLNPSLSVWTAGGTAHPELSVWPRIMGSVQGALRAEVADFIQTVQTGQASRVASAEDAVAGLAIVEAAQRSARERRPVQLDEITGQESA
jgi:predicted dehydrogenase